MSFLTPFVILFYVAVFETREIYRAHTITPQLAKVLEEVPDEDTDEDVYELLGLVILDYDTLLTRRNLEQPMYINTTQDQGKSEIFLRSRTQQKKKKSGHHKKTTKKPKTTKHKSHKDKEWEEMERREQEILREGSRPSNSFEEETERTRSRSNQKNDCVHETQIEMEKCVRACNRAHEDVCDRLQCSSRSQKALKRECGINCNRVFDPNTCYRREEHEST